MNDETARHGSPSVGPLTAAIAAAALSIAAGFAPVCDSWTVVITFGVLSSVLCFAGPVIQYRDAKLAGSALLWGLATYFGVRAFDLAGRFLCWNIFGFGTTTPVVFIAFRSMNTLVTGGVVGAGIASMSGEKRRIHQCFAIGALASIVTLLGQLLTILPDGIHLNTIEGWIAGSETNFREITVIAGRALTIVLPTAWIAARHCRPRMPW